MVLAFACSLAPVGSETSNSPNKKKAVIPSHFLPKERCRMWSSWSPIGSGFSIRTLLSDHSQKGTYRWATCLGRSIMNSSNPGNKLKIDRSWAIIRGTGMAKAIKQQALQHFLTTVWSRAERVWRERIIYARFDPIRCSGHSQERKKG